MRRTFSIFYVSRLLVDIKVSTFYAKGDVYAAGECVSEEAELESGEGSRKG
jgi:hypothetical protein